MSEKVYYIISLALIISAIFTAIIFNLDGQKNNAVADPQLPAAEIVNE